jgi:hypothetical protein
VPCLVSLSWSISFRRLFILSVGRDEHGIARTTVTRTPRTMDLLESSSDEDEISPQEGRADHSKNSTTGPVNDALSLLVQYAKSSKEGVLRAICDKWYILSILSLSMRLSLFSPLPSPLLLPLPLSLSFFFAGGLLSRQAF